jgi:ATP-binding cassette, subfamily B, bacterial
MLDAIVAAFTTLLPDVVLVVGIIVVLLLIDPVLALIALAVIPALAWLASAQRRRVKTSQYAARTANGRLSDTATDLLRNIRVLQAFHRQDLAVERFDERNRELLDREIDAIVIEARWSPRAELVLAVGAGLVLLIGGTRALSGALTVGTLLVVISYVTSLYRPIRSLARLASTFAKASASQSRLNELLHSTDHLSVDPLAVDAPAVSTGVRFRDVGFTYETGHPVLAGMDFSVASGEAVCIVGPSGTGKSTILHLLLRLYDVTSGAVELDGVDVRRCDLASLRRRIALVPQDPWLLDGSIADNIGLGLAGASRAAVLAAGRAALVDEFALALPDGYDTSVGEGGNRLSGGQRQRIAIARAILSPAPLLLLDEPGSALDAVASAAVLSAIRQSERPRTVIAVTHDLGLADVADRVIVVEHGHVVEQGPPERLAAAGGTYAWLRQLDRVSGGAPMPPARISTHRTRRPANRSERIWPRPAPARVEPIGHGPVPVGDHRDLSDHGEAEPNYFSYPTTLSRR